MVKEKTMKILNDFLAQKIEDSYLLFVYFFYGRENPFLKWWGDDCGPTVVCDFTYEQLMRLKAGLEDFLPCASEMGLKFKVEIVLQEVVSKIEEKKPLRKRIRSAFSLFWKSSLLFIGGCFLSLILNLKLLIGISISFLINFGYLAIKGLWEAGLEKIEKRIYEQNLVIIRQLKQNEIQDEWNRADAYFTKNLE